GDETRGSAAVIHRAARRAAAAAWGAPALGALAILALGGAAPVAKTAAPPPPAPPGAATPPAPAAESRAPRTPRLRVHADADGRIAASIYSLPSRLIATDEALAFLAGVHAAAPDRPLLVLADDAQERALRPRAAALGVRLLTTSRADYSPWPRDPFS